MYFYILFNIAQSITSPDAKQVTAVRFPSQFNFENLYFIPVFWQKILHFYKIQVFRGRAGQMSIVFACGVGHSKHPRFKTRAHL